MDISAKKFNVCDVGHRYYKKSDCPTCPICEEERKPESGFLKQLSAPARRALQHQGIHWLEILATYSEKKLLEFHGLGPASLPKLRASLKEQGMTLKF
ncbi:RNA polymerase alpha subunit C-terminal domain-containing protein [Sporosarcina sp. A2]|uniref:RNA polymerase alpha subunit C-terminal domain-containing protein n=1 Tax=Sporosarcina sp. A2 TaxID=3393449 RepID=UPI003D7A24AF